jgi:uncharacterized protein (TIGR02001 family)
MPWTLQRCVALCLPLWLALPCAPAFAQREAQWDAQLNWLSSERYRGTSLSDGKPAWHASLNVDHDSGLYGGAAASVNAGSPAHGQRLQLYAGMAQPLASTGLSWDVGAMAYRHTSGGEYQAYQYGEGYLGLMGDAWQARWAHAPRYAGTNLSANYMELDGLYKLTPDWAWQSHIGLLSLNHAPPATEAAHPLPHGPTQIDVRLALSTRWLGCRITMAADALASAHQSSTAWALALGWRL